MTRQTVSLLQPNDDDDKFNNIIQMYDDDTSRTYEPLINILVENVMIQRQAVSNDSHDPKVHELLTVSTGVK